jgi:HlyD family secretion protein
VLVPADAVHDGDGAGAWVLRFEDGHARRHNVRLGLRSGGLSEVLGGLQAGDRVVPVSATGIRDGSRLRVAGPDPR